MARQAVLERLGWRFVRIRGSEFFRDPERAMRPVWSKLEEFGIPAEQGPDSANDSDVAGSELRERLIQRAQELRLGREKRDLEPDSFEADEQSMAIEEVIGIKERAAARRVSEAKESLEPPTKRPHHGAEASPGRLAAKRAKTPGQKERQIDGSGDRDRVIAVLRSHLENQGTECKKCNGPMYPMLGRYGPFAKCSRDGCANTMTIAPKVLTGTLVDLDASCKVCSSPLIPRTSKYGGFIGYSKYPECNERLSWQDLRKNMRRLRASAHLQPSSTAPDQYSWEAERSSSSAH
jgi:hypothetical protein